MRATQLTATFSVENRAEQFQHGGTENTEVGALRAPTIFLRELCASVFQSLDAGQASTGWPAFAGHDS